MCKVGIRAEVRAMIDAAPFIIVFTHYISFLSGNIRCEGDGVVMHGGHVDRHVGELSECSRECVERARFLRGLPVSLALSGTLPLVGRTRGGGSRG